MDYSEFVAVIVWHMSLILDERGNSLTGPTSTSEGSFLSLRFSFGFKKIC